MRGGRIEAQHTNLAALLAHLSEGVGKADEDFARGVALSLEAHAEHLRIPIIDAMGIQEVMVTLYMDQEVRLVVTGHLTIGTGAVTVSWKERNFHEIPVHLDPSPGGAPYTFATLDFSVRGRRGRLRVDAPPLGAGLEVRVRALATIGTKVEYRIQAHGFDRSVPPEDLELYPL